VAALVSKVKEGARVQALDLQIPQPPPSTFQPLFKLVLKVMKKSHFSQIKLEISQDIIYGRNYIY